MAFGLLCTKKKKNCVCLVFVNILGIIKGHLGLRNLLFLLELSESIVRSFSMDLGNTLGMRFGLLHTRSLDHYLHHHSHLIVTCFDLAFLGRVVRRCHTLHICIPACFSIFLLYPFIIYYAYKGLAIFIGYLGLCFPSRHSPFTPGLHYSPSRKTTLRP